MSHRFLFIILLIVLGAAATAQEGSDNSFMYRDAKEILQAAQTYEKQGDKHVLNVLTDTAGLKITRKDVAELVKHVYSQRKCRCIVSPFSSYMPAWNEYSTLGGIAMDMIDAYRNGMKYPHKGWLCTKTDRTRADEIVQWWNREKEK